MSVLWTGPPNEDVVVAVAFARGIPGLMKASPDAADAGDVFTLLRYASRIEAAEESTP